MADDYNFDLGNHQPQAPTFTDNGPSTAQSPTLQVEGTPSTLISDSSASLKPKKDQKTSTIRKEDNDLNTTRQRSRNSDKEAMRDKEKNSDTHNRRRSSELEKNKPKTGALSTTSTTSKKASNLPKVSSTLPKDLLNSKNSSFKFTGNIPSPSRPIPSSPLSIELEKEEAKETSPTGRRDEHMAARDEDSEARIRPTEHEDERPKPFLPDDELEALISCRKELSTPTKSTHFPTQSPSNPIPWQSFDVLTMTQLPALEQWWQSIRELTAHHKWMNMAQLLLQYMFSQLSPRAGEEWTKMISESANPDLSAFISWILASPSNPQGFSITHNPHPAWDSLSTQAKGKYALLRYSAVQFQLSRIFLMFWAGLLQSVSFKDGCTLPFDFSSSQTTKHSIQQWILKANKNPFQTSTLQDNTLEEVFKNQKVLQQRWIEAHQVSQDPNHQDFQSEIATILNMNFGFIPSLGTLDYVFPLLREMAMKIPDHTTAIQDFKASFPFSKNLEQNSWKIRSTNLGMQTFAEPPTDLLHWTHSQGLNTVLPDDRGFIMTKLELKATIRALPPASPLSASSPKIQISIHPVRPSTHERYPPFIIRESSLPLLTTNSQVLHGLFTLNSTFTTNEVESIFLMDQFFLNQGHICFESILKCSPEQQLQSILISQQFEGFTGDLKSLSYYLFALWMYSYSRSSLTKISEQVLKDIASKKKGAREALLIVFPDESCNGVKF